MWLFESTGNVCITHCTFQNNSATRGGGAVGLSRPIDDVSITYCTFQDNSVSITYNYCTFQCNSASYGGAVALDGSIIFNGSACNGGANAIIIYNSTFTNNSALC